MEGMAVKFSEGLSCDATMHDMLWEKLMILLLETLSTNEPSVNIEI